MFTSLAHLLCEIHTPSCTLNPGITMPIWGPVVSPIQSSHNGAATHNFPKPTQPTDLFRLGVSPRPETDFRPNHKRGLVGMDPKNDPRTPARRAPQTPFSDKTPFSNRGMSVQMLVICEDWIHGSPSGSPQRTIQSDPCLPTVLPPLNLV